MKSQSEADPEEGHSQNREREKQNRVFEYLQEKNIFWKQNYFWNVSVFFLWYFNKPIFSNSLASKIYVNLSNVDCSERVNFSFYFLAAELCLDHWTR